MDKNKQKHLYGWLRKQSGHGRRWIGLSIGLGMGQGILMVMQAWLLNKPMIIVLLDSFGRFTRVADAQRVKRWLESAAVQQKVAANLRGPAT